MSRRSGILVAVLVAAPIAAIGCNRQVDERTEPERQATTDTAATGTVQRSDTDLTTAVQARLYAEDSLRGEGIDVRVVNGVATLSGSVNSETAEQQALRTAGDVEGISRVDDQITVNAGQRANRDREDGAAATSGVDPAVPGWITTKIQAQYFIDPDIKPWNIDVTTTSGGLVELRGDVESAAAKAEAVRIARETEGVTRVEDHLRVRTAASGDDTGATGAGGDRIASDVPGGDAWITAKIQSKYFLDDDVKGRDIDVTTQNQNVTLRGTVDSERERRQAVAIARNTDAVRQVDDQLQVMPMNRAGDDAREPAAARGAAGNVIQGVDDAWITTKVQSQYFLDTEVKGHEIDVDTRNGVVTLTGSVESDAAKQLAETIARDTDGVSRVVNRLTIEPTR